MMSTGNFNYNKNSQVRREVIEQLSLSKASLQLILKRTRDENSDVREAAYKKIMNCVRMKILPIQKRVNLLVTGLLDRSDKIKKITNLLINEWLSQCESNTIKFLEKLDVEMFRDDCEVIMKNVFENIPEQHKLSIDKENLTSELTFFWRCKCDYYKNKNEEDKLEENLLNITNFCSLIIKHSTMDVNEFIVKELFILSKHLDYCDEVGRSKMFKLLSEMLIAYTKPDLYVKEIVETLFIVSSSMEELES
jgi:condensin complex subunit 3